MTHHTNLDSYERLQPSDMMKNATIAASFAYLAANRDEKLPRKPLPAPSQEGGVSNQVLLGSTWFYRVLTGFCGFDKVHVVQAIEPNPMNLVEPNRTKQKVMATPSSPTAAAPERTIRRRSPRP